MSTAACAAQHSTVQIPRHALRALWDTTPWDATLHGIRCDAVGLVACGVGSPAYTELRELAVRHGHADLGGAHSREHLNRRNGRITVTAQASLSLSLSKTRHSEQPLATTLSEWPINSVSVALR